LHSAAAPATDDDRQSVVVWRRVMRKFVARIMITVGVLAACLPVGASQTNAQTQVQAHVPGIAELLVRAERGDADAQYRL
jgi:hypothetical protein